MTKKEQLEIIEKEFPLHTNFHSDRRLRHEFFSNIITELQAYLLGFYAADGSVDEKRKTLRIHLQKLDSEIVYLFKDTISPDARVFTVLPHTTTGRNGMIINANESFGVDINSTHIVNDLVSLGFGYKKSYKDLELPNINPNLIRHFIRGYFDGDGSIIGWLSSEKGKKDRFRTKFTIIGKSKSFFESVQNYFKINNINTNINYVKRDDLYRIETSSKVEVYKLFNLLYNDSNFYLLRKFNKFNYYVNTEVSQLIADHRNAQEMSDNESNNFPKSAEHPNGMKMCAEPSDE